MSHQIVAAPFGWLIRSRGRFHGICPAYGVRTGATPYREEAIADLADATLDAFLSGMEPGTLSLRERARLSWMAVRGEAERFRLRVECSNFPDNCREG
ncbi:hypothetical protein E8L99_16495 [Phreatobacter aquaticus]|uniref:Uncharacterized protein n=1 Tax=Phreatobacter aquaticus TaxID=2570229 RepID=A0A4D7QKW6_9HYPH|nr:hypothetical protein [Phreatobacter aquaticus]QCK87241.1 hypothetical protein E8L99_16495 [Phreatobacter aquaticus]